MRDMREYAVVSHEYGVDASGMRRDHQVHWRERLSCALQFGAQCSILLSHMGVPWQDICTQQEFVNDPTKPR